MEKIHPYQLKILHRELFQKWEQELKKPLTDEEASGRAQAFCEAMSLIRRLIKPPYPRYMFYYEAF